jgi:hypothetical protein
MGWTSACYQSDVAVRFQVVEIASAMSDWASSLYSVERFRPCRVVSISKLFVGNGVSVAWCRKWTDLRRCLMWA